MENTNRYIYPFVITLIVVALGAGYLFFNYGKEDVVGKDFKNEKLVDYIQRIEDLEGLKLETDILESEIYWSLTDDFRREVEEVSIGKVNPFRSF